jgi:hypothetical protein
VPPTTSRSANAAITRLPIVVAFGLIAVAFVLNAAYFSQLYGHGFMPELAKWLPVSAPILGIATLLIVAVRPAGTSSDRLGVRVALGLWVAYAVFVAGLQLLRPTDDARGLALAQGSLAIVVCCLVCAVSIFLARGLRGRVGAADANRAAIQDWKNRS